MYVLFKEYIYLREKVLSRVQHLFLRYTICYVVMWYNLYAHKDKKDYGLFSSTKVVFHARRYMKRWSVLNQENVINAKLPFFSIVSISPCCTWAWLFYTLPYNIRYNIDVFHKHILSEKNFRLCKKSLSDLDRLFCLYAY